MSVDVLNTMAAQPGQSPSLVDLASKVTELSQTFTRFLEENNTPAPTFAADSVTSYENLTPEIFQTRQLLLDTLMDMCYLAQGPSESVFNYVHTCMPDVATLNILNYFNFWSAVPLSGSATYPEIAQRTSLPQDAVQRILEHAVTLRIFSAAEPGKSTTSIQHTSRSAALARSSGLRALVSTLLGDAGPPMMVMNEALQKYSRGKADLPRDMSETSFALFHSGGTFGKFDNSWDLLENDGEGEDKGWRQKNFVEFMRYIKEIFRLESVVLDSFDWVSAGKATVVDLGGSGGHDDVVLARKYPDLNIIVQDLPKVEPAFNTNVPDELKSRVTFIAHDFFQPQPVQADIYMIKLILHDWPDQEAVKILRGLRPSLKPGARIIFIDYVGKQGEPEGPPLPRSIQQMGTATDLRMMALFNAEERPVEAWKKVFKSADERFEIVRVKADPMTFMVVMEVEWRG